MTDLKKCPFCSGEVKTIVKAEKLTGGRKLYRLYNFLLGMWYCKKVRMKCGIHGASFLEVEEAMDEVIFDWNRRAGENG